MKLNKMKHTLIFISALLLNLSLQAQDKANALLDEVYTKVQQYENIQVDFRYALTNTEANINQETRGDVTMSGDKYVFNYLGAQQMFDGKKIYTIVPENEEITIDDQSEDEDTVTPSKMFTFYRKGHNASWDILQNVKGHKVQFVKLIPIDSNSEIEHILLGIDVETKHIYKLIEAG
ncbi:MAG: outer membrane lipoprotein carrier protein LolA, partial [Eudoraea sp.]|nr:outer membrane lipoprotein carrier protein LolA [Eudoraea sp.]